MKDWKPIVDAREKDITITNEKGKKITKRGQSTWKQELKKINDYKELMELYDFLDNEFKSDVTKFFTKGTKAAGRRARYYAQKIKDTMGQIRDVIQKTK